MLKISFPETSKIVSHLLISDEAVIAIASEYRKNAVF